MDNRSATKETLVLRSGLKKAVRRIIGITQEAIRIPELRSPTRSLSKRYRN